MSAASALGGHCVLLGIKPLLGQDQAPLEDYDAISEDEIDRASDGALSVELAVAVRVERVLVASEGAAEECGVVGVRPESNRLVFLRPCCVIEGHITRYEPWA